MPEHGGSSDDTPSKQQQDGKSADPPGKHSGKDEGNGGNPSIGQVN